MSHMIWTADPPDANSRPLPSKLTVDFWPMATTEETRRADAEKRESEGRILTAGGQASEESL